MKDNLELILGLSVSSLGTVLNLIYFISSNMNFGIIFNIIYLLFPFLIGISFIIHSMNRTLNRARSELENTKVGMK